MQRKTAKKEAWRPKCATPRLVYYSALFFETFMHVYVLRTRPNTFSQKNKKKHPSEVGSRDGHVEHVCKSSASICKRRRGHLDFCAENMPPSPTIVHGGQYDTKYVGVFNTRVDCASGIRGGGNFRRLPWTSSYQPTYRNTRNRTRRCYNLYQPVRHIFKLNTKTINRIGSIWN